jgi:hypothetical protein
MLKADGYLRAGDRIRTDDNNVGNVVLYQLSYTRIALVALSLRERAGARVPLGNLSFPSAHSKHSEL